MTTESANDAFERRYMGKFQEQAANYGVAVRYERDRAARDIGVHFFRKTRSGTEEATGSSVWFQMKGIQASTLSDSDFSKAPSVAISLKVKDLQLWYRMNGPTYLAVYIESADRFLVLNIVEYVAERYGAEILTLDQKTVDIPVSTTSVLDAQAFALIVRKGTAEEWARVLGADSGDVHLAQRDYRLLWRLATATERGVEHRLRVTDWQSKTRGEVRFHERPVGGPDDSWRAVREHWQLMLRIEGLEGAYPYLSFEPSDQQRQDDIEYWSNEDNEPFVEFSDGTVVYGKDCAGEYNAYELRPRLNSIGRRLAAIVAALVETSMIDAPNDNDAEMLDVAPWHARDV